MKFFALLFAIVPSLQTFVEESFEIVPTEAAATEATEAAATDATEAAATDATEAAATEAAGTEAAATEATEATEAAGTEAASTEAAGTDATEAAAVEAAAVEADATEAAGTEAATAAAPTAAAVPESTAVEVSRKVVSLVADEEKGMELIDLDSPSNSTEAPVSVLDSQGFDEPEPSAFGLCARSVLDCLPLCNLAASAIPDRKAKLAVTTALKVAAQADAQFFYHDLRRDVLHSVTYLRVADAHLKVDEDVTTLLNDKVITSLASAIERFEERAGDDASTGLARYVNIDLVTSAKGAIEFWASAPNKATWPAMYTKSVADLGKVAAGLLKLEKSNVTGCALLFCCKKL